MTTHAPQPRRDLRTELDWLRRMARRTVSDPTAADDLAQDALVAALEGRAEEGRPLRPWLLRILRNYAWDWLRREGERRSRESEALASRRDGAPDLLAGAIQAERRARLADELALLPPAQREVIELRYYAGLNSSEIGSRLGLTPSTVRSRLMRGLDELRTRLSEAADAEEGRRLRKVPAWLAFFVPQRPRGRRLAGAWRATLAAGVAAVVIAVTVPATRHAVRSSATPTVGRDAPSHSSLHAAVSEARRPTAPPVTPVRADATPQEDERRVGFRWQIVDEDGLPLAGVLRLKQEFLAGPLELSQGGELWLEPDLVQDIGTFCFQAEAPGRVSSRFSVLGRPGELTDLGRIRLPRGASVAGRVRFTDGRPGAGLRVLSSDAVRLPDPDRPGVEPAAVSAFLPDTVSPDYLGWFRGGCLTDDGGEFRIDGLPPGTNRLWVLPPFGETGCEVTVGDAFVLAPGDERAGFELIVSEEPEGTRAASEDAPAESEIPDPAVVVTVSLEGRVVPDATVHVLLESTAGSWPPPVGTTDAQGRLTLSVPTEESYRLASEVRPGLVATWGPFEGPHVPPVLAAEAGGEVVGRLLTDDPRDAAFRVVALSRPDGQAWTTRSDGSGRFSFGEKTAGAWSAGVLGMDAPPSSSFLHELVAREPEAHLASIEVVRGAVRELTLDLRACRSSRVRLEANALPVGGHGWSARLQRRGSLGPSWGPARPVGGAGAVELTTHAAGEHELVLLNVLDTGVARITAPVELEPGRVTSWHAYGGWQRLEVPCGPAATLLRARARLSATDTFDATVAVRDGLAILPLAPTAGLSLSLRIDGTWRELEPAELDPETRVALSSH